MKPVHILSLIILWSSGNGIGGVHIPYAHVVSSFASEYFFVMLPAPEGDKLQSKGICYHIEENGEFKMFLTLEGCYSHPGNAFLSDDGEVLVRIMEATGEAEKLGPKTILEFYRKGKLTRKQLIKDIVDPSKLQRSSLDPGYYDVVVSDWTNSPQLASVVKLGNIVPDTELHKAMLKFDGNRRVFSFATVQEERLVFDAQDGTLLYRAKIKQESKEPADTDPFREQGK